MLEEFQTQNTSFNSPPANHFQKTLNEISYMPNLGSSSASQVMACGGNFAALLDRLAQNPKVLK